jgi:hypothetical protein
MLIGSAYTATYQNEFQNILIGSSQFFTLGDTTFVTCNAQFGVNNTYFPLFEATTTEQFDITLVFF